MKLSKIALIAALTAASAAASAATVMATGQLEYTGTVQSTCTIATTPGTVSVNNPTTATGWIDVRAGTLGNTPVSMTITAPAGAILNFVNATITNTTTGVDYSNTISFGKTAAGSVMLSTGNTSIGGSSSGRSGSKGMLVLSGDLTKFTWDGESLVTTGALTNASYTFGLNGSNWNASGAVAGTTLPPGNYKVSMTANCSL